MVPNFPFIPVAGDGRAPMNSMVARLRRGVVPLIRAKKIAD